MPPTPITDIKKALVIKLGHIGDVLVTTPVVSALKRAFPQASLTMLVNQGTEDMIRHNPDLDQVLVLERGHEGRLAGLRFQAGLIRRLRGAGFDLSLDLSGGDRGAFLSFISGAPFRVGFKPKKPHVRERAFHLTVSGRGTENHVVDTHLRQVRALGLEPGDARLRFFPGPEAEGKAREIMAARGLKPGGFALVHPTSRWMFKTWTVGGVAGAIRHLQARGLPVVMSAAPAAKEMDFTRSVLDLLGPGHGVLDLSGQLDLLLLGALIAQARIFFGVDSAPMHMAAALGTPTAVLFGPSGEKMWGPWQTPSRVVTMDMDCRPCGRDGCEGSKISRCLTELPLEMATTAIDELLDEGN